MALGVLAGGATSTTVNVVAFSGTSGDITLTMNGASHTISTSLCGNDRDTVVSPAPDGLGYMGYVGNTTVSGLTPFTKYAYSVSKDGETKSGECWTLPERHTGAKYSVALTTCLTSLNSVDEGRSIFKFLNWYRQNETEFPLIAHVHPDDFGYPDGGGGMESAEKAYDANVANFAITTCKPSEYNFSVVYTAILGAYAYTVNQQGRTFAYPDFAEYIRSVSVFTQAGDHEYYNNIWSTNDINTIPNPLHATPGGYDGTARVAWNNFMKPLCGELFATANTESYHWSVDFGELQIIAPDCVSNVAYSGGITAALGTDQIEEILTKIDNDKPFKVFANPAFAFRSPAAGDPMKYKSEQWVEAEYNRLVLDDGTAGTPLSIMNNPNTNGVVGAAVFTRGDSHYGSCYKFSAAAAGTNLAENFYEIGLCSSNGGRGGSQGLPGYFVTYQPYTSDLEFVGGIGTPGSTHEVCVILEIDASVSPATMTVKRYDRNWKDGNNLPEPNNVVDSTFFIEPLVGPDTEYALTFQKKFAPFQNNNLGADASTEFTHPVLKRASQDSGAME